VTERDEFLAALRGAVPLALEPPELPPLRAERGSELAARFIVAAEASGARIHHGVDPDSIVAGRGADEVGVSRAAYGLADTGSVVLLAAPEEPRARSLLPPVHVTILDEDDLLPGLAELFAEVGPSLPSALAVVTGPSRSADIEQSLTIGVHGPGEVHIVLT